MSRRTANASKAIRLAWEREQKLVSEGKGTRDWTDQQQLDILEKGKAYDDFGRAFEGQHMKSVEQFPSYQENPDNIQFLTRDEHLEAHKGNWNNPTNWFYNPVTKEFSCFKDNELIPCKIFPLSNPIKKISRVKETENPTNRKKENFTKGTITDSRKFRLIRFVKKVNIFQRIKGGLPIFIKNAPYVLPIVGAAIVKFGETVANFKQNTLSNGADKTPKNIKNENGGNKEKRASPTLHDVNSYIRTVNGVQQNVKAYKRGGKNK